MSSFWSMSNGEAATGEVVESNFDPLPKDWYLSMLESVEVDEYQGQKKVKIKARVIGEGFGKNRVLFLNLKCFAGDEIKETARDRAIQILVKMYNICKAKLPNGEPDDSSLSQLVDKPINLFLDVWELEDKSKSGNWLLNVEAKGVAAGVKTAAKESAKAKQNEEYDDIPF
jgi:hypothetical protein